MMKKLFLILNLMTLSFYGYARDNQNLLNKGNMKIELTAENATKEYSVEKRIVLQQGGESEEVTVLYTEDLSVDIDNTNSLQPITKVLRSNVKKDGMSHPQNPVEYYFIKSGEILNDLVLQLTPEGRIEKVVNYDEVLKNWEYTKIFLDNYFVSDDENIVGTIKGWTHHIDQIVKDETLFLHYVRQDILYDRFFTDYNGKRIDGIRNNVFPAIFGNAVVILNEEMTISEKDGEKQVEVIGHLNKDSSDMLGIATSLGLETPEVDELSVDLKSIYLFDNYGLVSKIDLSVDVELEDAGVKRSYVIKINEK